MHTHARTHRGRRTWRRFLFRPCRVWQWSAHQLRKEAKRDTDFTLAPHLGALCKAHCALDSRLADDARASQSGRLFRHHRYRDARVLKCRPCPLDRRSTLTHSKCLPRSNTRAASFESLARSALFTRRKAPAPIDCPGVIKAAKAIYIQMTSFVCICTHWASNAQSINRRLTLETAAFAFEQCDIIVNLTKRVSNSVFFVKSSSASCMSIRRANLFIYLNNSAAC